MLYQTENLSIIFKNAFSNFVCLFSNTLLSSQIQGVEIADFYWLQNALPEWCPGFRGPRSTCLPINSLQLCVVHKDRVWHVVPRPTRDFVQKGFDSWGIKYAHSHLLKQPRFWVKFGGMFCSSFLRCWISWIFSSKNANFALVLQKYIRPYFSFYISIDAENFK